MPAICNSCGEETTRYVTRFYGARSITECRVCTHPRHSAQSGCVNPYADLTLEHVRDEEGKPVRVTSRRQLDAAEKRYKFKSVVGNMMSENFDKPPQQRPPSAPDRILQQLTEAQGKRDAQGNRTGFLYPEIAAAQLREIKERGIDINKW